MRRAVLVALVLVAGCGGGSSAKVASCAEMFANGAKAPATNDNYPSCTDNGRTVAISWGIWDCGGRELHYNDYGHWFADTLRVVSPSDPAPTKAELDEWCRE